MPNYLVLEIVRMEENLPKISERHYPKFYERFVPVVIGALVLVVVLMLAFTLAVGTGLLVLG